MPHLPRLPLLEDDEDGPPPDLHFSLWMFINVIIPAAPILIQYGMQWLNVYHVKFPQSDYMMMLFALALVTLTEYRKLSSIIYGCVVPALIACALYTAFVLKENDPAATVTIELRGFQFWCALLAANFIRVVNEGIKRLV